MTSDQRLAQHHAMADGTITVELDEDLAIQVKAAASAQGIPVSMFVRDALAFHVGDDTILGDDPDPAIDEAIIEDALRTGETIPCEEIIAWMQSWFKPDELPMPGPSTKR